MRFVRATLLLSAAVTSSLGAQGQLRGRVFDAANQEPLFGVSISTATSQLSATSDRNGLFSIPCPGTSLLLTFRRTGYLTFQTTVTDCTAPLQVGLSQGAQSLNAVKVVASTEHSALEQPQSVTALTRKELTRSSGLFLEEPLNLTPGIRMENRTMSGGQRITIRGYGQGSNFNGSGYKAYLNGIPITDAEGVTILDDIDFASLGRVEVVRGPASSMYGTGIGGVVNMFTMRPEQDGTTVTQEVLTGSDGLSRINSRIASNTSGSSVLFNYGKQNYDSYRLHSASKKDYAHFLGDFRPSTDRVVTTYLSYAHSYDQRAGQLDSSQFFGKQNTGESRYLNNDAHVNIEGLRAGVSHTYRISDRVENAVTVFYSGNSTDDAFAAGLNVKSLQNFGGRVALNTTFPGATVLLSGTTGLEYQKTNSNAKSYALTNNVPGAMRSDLETHTAQYSIFSQWSLDLPSNISIAAGASLNHIKYAISDRMTTSANPTHLDASGFKDFDAVLTPRISVAKIFGGSKSVYATLSQGYSPPTSSDAVIPFTGETNDGLKPERATLVELGTKGTVLNSKLSWQLALFDMKVTDKLTSQSVFDGNTVLYSFTVNAGDQDNRGLELALGYQLLGNSDSFVSSLRPFLTYTWSDFTYSNFKSNNNDNSSTISYDGNSVVGVPETVLNFGFDAEFAPGLYLNATYQHVDAMPLTYDNVHEAPAFSLLNAKLGLVRNLSDRLRLHLFTGGKNLGSSLHYTMVFLNGNYSGAPPAIYLPGPYRATFFSGGSLSFHF